MQNCLQKKQLWLNICTNFHFSIYLGDPCGFQLATSSGKRKVCSLTPTCFLYFMYLENGWKSLMYLTQFNFNVKIDILQKFVNKSRGIFLQENLTPLPSFPTIPLIPHPLTHPTPPSKKKKKREKKSMENGIYSQTGIYSILFVSAWGTSPSTGWDWVQKYESSLLTDLHFHTSLISSLKYMCLSIHICGYTYAHITSITLLSFLVKF